MRAFLQVINAWQEALGRRPFAAEVLETRSDAPLRVIRFFVNETAEVRLVATDSDLNSVLQKIGERMRLPISARITAVRELRVHGDDELLVIKPAARRFWTAACALNDADAALADGLRERST